MENREHILNELKEVSPLLAEIPPGATFSVPEGYFNGLSNGILEQLKRNILLDQASDKTYSVPEGYFEALPGNIVSMIQAGETRRNEEADELDEVAPLLNIISRKNVYEVPQGYFEQADFSAHTKQQPKKEARIITFNIARKWLQYVAAAVVTGVLVTGAFIFTDSNTYLENQNLERIELSSELNKVSATDLVTYLNNPEHVVPAPATTASASEEELMEVKNNIQQLSDEELNRYMKENAESFEAVASEKED